MIRTIKHKGLRDYFERGRSRRLNADWLGRVDRILNALNLAQIPADMDLPGFRLHPLRGDLEGFYAVNVSGNWRIIFRFEEGHVTDIDLVDYH
jgi:proteic killer suppression protein